MTIKGDGGIGEHAHPPPLPLDPPMQWIRIREKPGLSSKKGTKEEVDINVNKWYKRRAHGLLYPPQCDYFYLFWKNCLQTIMSIVYSPTCIGRPMLKMNIGLQFPLKSSTTVTIFSESYCFWLINCIIQKIDRLYYPATRAIALFPHQCEASV